jgi:hypothetical protein
MISVRIVKSLVSGIQLLQIPERMLSYPTQGRALVHGFSFLKYRYHEFPHLELFGVGFIDMAEHGMIGSKRASPRDFFIIKKKHITSHLTLLIVHPYHLFETRIHYLFRVI